MEGTEEVAGALVLHEDVEPGMPESLIERLQWVALLSADQYATAQDAVEAVDALEELLADPPE